MKLLYILNQTTGINSFSISSIQAASSMGIDYQIAGNWSYASEADRMRDEEKYGIRIYHVDFHRKPYHPGNLKAYSQLSRIAKREKFDAIHCNTPIGGLIGRLIGQRFGVKKVIYQAHGFHFYRGAPFLNWLLYYPVEKWMARLTDDLICINQEDYQFACEKLKLRNNGKIYYIPGVGINTKQYELSRTHTEISREMLGVPSDAPLVLSVGELNTNKNHATVIQALGKLSKVHYAIAGKGPLDELLWETARKVGVSDRVHLLGFRTDLAEIYPLADVFCLPSSREGLSTSIMEAMASGLPVVCSDIRGNRDLVIQEQGGYLVKPMDVSGFAAAIGAILNNPEKRNKMAAFNVGHASQFGLERIIDITRDIYQQSFDML